AARSSLICLAIAVTAYPSATSRRTIARPIPRLPPVTTTCRPLATGAHHLAGSAHVQRRHEANHDRNLVERQLALAMLKDLVPDAALAVAGRPRLVVQHHVRGHERPGDRAALRLHDRHAHRRMLVDDGLDFLGIHLEAADVDDAGATAQEDPAVAARFDHIARV